jgi:hypothetical protein
MNTNNDDIIKKSLLYMNYDSKKTLSENYQKVLLIEQTTTYKGPFYPSPLVPGSSETAGFGSYNYRGTGQYFKTGAAGSKFSVTATEFDGTVVVVRADDLGIKFRYKCKDNTKDSYKFNFKNGDIYDKGKWNKTCCTKVQNWNADYWNDEDGTDNWAIDGLGQLLYKDYCQAKTVKKDEKKNEYKLGGGGKGTSWNQNCKPNYYFGCMSTVIGQAQQCLKDQGLYPYAPDNKFGKKTREGVRSKLGKDTFSDSDLQTICKTNQGGGGEQQQQKDDLNIDNYTNTTPIGQNKQDTTWAGDLY